MKQVSLNTDKNCTAGKLTAATCLHPGTIIWSEFDVPLFQNYNFSITMTVFEAERPR